MYHEAERDNKDKRIPWKFEKRNCKIVKFGLQKLNLKVIQL